MVENLPTQLIQNQSLHEFPSEQEKFWLKYDKNIKTANFFTEKILRILYNYKNEE